MTWHGPFRLKKIEGEVEDKLTKQYVKDAKYDGSIMDFTTVSNDDMYNSIKNFFWYNGEVLKVGVPRNSILQNTTDDVLRKVYNTFNIPKDKKIAFYCPTFRDNGDVSVYNFNYNKVLDALESKFSSEYVLLIKFHPNVKVEDVKFIQYGNRIINANCYNDTIELLACADVCITDYSGLMFDGMAFKKKVFLFANDFESYGKGRGFIFDLTKLPAEIATTQEKLIKNIYDFNKESYLNRCKEFFNEIGLVEKDTSLEVICNKIYEIIGV